MPINQFFKDMLKIPTFILGGLLILTGLAGYLFQDPGLSLKLTGPLADDAEFTLSDGNDSVVVDLGFPSSKSAGEYAFWMVHSLNQNHAKDRSQANYAVEQGSTAYETQSLARILQRRHTGCLGTPCRNRGTRKFSYNGYKQLENPISLQELYRNHFPYYPHINQRNNVESKIELKPGDSLEFYKVGPHSFLELLESFSSLSYKLLRLNLMQENTLSCGCAYWSGWIYHVSLQNVAKCYVRNELAQGEPYGIIQASSLKPTVMLASAGLLLVFVILCVVSFITARKEMAAQKKLEADKKKKVLDKVKSKNEEADADDKKSDKDDDKDGKKEKSSDEKKEDDDKKSDDDVKGSDSKDSEDKDESEDSIKADDNSKSAEAPKPEQEKEAAKATENAPETKKEDDAPTADKKSSEAPKNNPDIKVKKPEEPSKHPRLMTLIHI